MLSSLTPVSPLLTEKSWLTKLIQSQGEDGEVTFQDVADLSKARKKKGFSKILETCRLARTQGYDYTWIDTCCIDKSSSAELTEAINSMFNWYKQSAICYAFLYDLPAERETGRLDFVPSLSQCRWFTRGWTLQELVAPEKVEFYDQTWQIRGTRSSLQQELSSITGIDTDVIVDSNLLTTIPVARRMSWAANRQTTRVEDLAYSLLGIFDVNLPLIYGEGPKAFIRLQEEIIKQHNDLSLVRSLSLHMNLAKKDA
jgi:Heterokaryon incompatibility protein (HET)